MACIGLAFMLVELPLLTRLAIVLGHPVLALAVVLGGLLAASGLGSLLSAELSPKGRRMVVAFLPIACAGLAVSLGGLAPLIASHAAPARVAASLLLVILFGLPMGVPLPAGLSWAAGPEGRAAPLLFGINGAFSVMGSVLGMVLLLNAGARVTLGAGTLCYALAALLLARGRTSGP